MCSNQATRLSAFFLSALVIMAQDKSIRYRVVGYGSKNNIGVVNVLSAGMMRKNNNNNNNTDDDVTLSLSD
eukprot:scaffold311_cov173-Amphora_coffeaeformis.AAC.9